MTRGPERQPSNVRRLRQTTQHNPAFDPPGAATPLGEAFQRYNQLPLDPPIEDLNTSPAEAAVDHKPTGRRTGHMDTDPLYRGFPREDGQSWEDLIRWIRPRGRRKPEFFNERFYPDVLGGQPDPLE